MTLESATTAITYLATTGTIQVFVATGIAALTIVAARLLSAARRLQD